jgi:hypothetical protein
MAGIPSSLRTLAAALLAGVEKTSRLDQSRGSLFHFALVTEATSQGGAGATNWMSSILAVRSGLLG